jgi:hypothetical protein
MKREISRGLRVWIVASVLIMSGYSTITQGVEEGAGVSSVANANEVKTVKRDFESAAVGTVPRGWSVSKTGTGEGSDWRVVEDKTAPKGPKALAQTAESPGPMFNLCVADNTRFKDVEVSVAFKSVRGKTDQGGGIVWRFQDADNYYIARFNPLEDNYRLYKVVDGRRRQLATKEDLKAPAGQWHTLAVQMKGEQIVCLLNGKKQLEAKDDTFGNSGKVGLWTKADARTLFDDFQAKEPAE